MELIKIGKKYSLLGDLRIINAPIRFCHLLNRACLTGVLFLLKSLGQKRKPQQKFSLVVSTDLNALEKVLEWFKEVAAPLLPGPSYRDCQTALTEGFTNAVRHAHNGLPPKTPIRLEVDSFKQYLEIRIWDRGKPFDLEKQLENQKEKQKKIDPHKTQTIPEGGRGLIWMEKFTDELKYKRLEGKKNCLVMRKNLT